MLVRILCIATICVILYAVVNRSIEIRTEILIDAPPDKVFAILVDFEHYPDWNPYHTKVKQQSDSCNLAVEITRPDGRVLNLKPSLLQNKRDIELTWGGGVKGIFWGEHTFLLRPQSDGSTVLVHNEDFVGLAVGFADLPPEVIAEGYRSVNLALKAEAERKPIERRSNPE